MKHIFSVIVIFVSLSLNAQTIKKNGIDKFTKERTIETSYIKLSSDLLKLSTKSLNIAFSKIGKDEFILFKLKSNSTQGIDPGAKIMFLDDEENVYNFECTEVEKITGNNNLISFDGFNDYETHFRAIGDLSIFENKTFTDIRIHFLDQKIDFKIDNKANLRLSKLSNIYSKALK